MVIYVASVARNSFSVAFIMIIPMVMTMMMMIEVLGSKKSRQVHNVLTAAAPFLELWSEIVGFVCVCVWDTR